MAVNRNLIVKFISCSILKLGSHSLSLLIIFRITVFCKFIGNLFSFNLQGQIPGWRCHVNFILNYRCNFLYYFLSWQLSNVWRRFPWRKYWKEKKKKSYIGQRTLHYMTHAHNELNQILAEWWKLMAIFRQDKFENEIPSDICFPRVMPLS